MSLSLRPRTGTVHRVSKTTAGSRLSRSSDRLDWALYGAGWLLLFANLAFSSPAIGLGLLAALLALLIWRLYRHRDWTGTSSPWAAPEREVRARKGLPVSPRRARCSSAGPDAEE